LEFIKYDKSFRLNLTLLLLAIVLSLSTISTIGSFQLPYFQVVDQRIQSRILRIHLTGSDFVDSCMILVLLLAVLAIPVKIQRLRPILKCVKVASLIPIILLIFLRNSILTNISILGIIWMYILVLFGEIRSEDKTEMRRAAFMFIFWIMLIIAVIEGLAAAYWIMYPSGSSSLPVQFTHYFAEMELQFFSVFSGLSPLLVLVLLISPPVALLLDRDGSYRLLSLPKLMPQFLGGSTGSVLLGTGILISIVAATYPLSPTLNPGFEPYSVDFEAYRTALGNLADQGFSASLCTPDRVLSYAFIYAFYRMSGLSVSATVMYLPVLLGPFLVLVTYLLGKEILKEPILAGLSSLFAATSYTITVGMFAGLYANWLANCFLVLFLCLFVRWNRTHSILTYMLMTAASLMTLLSHTYTWSLLMASALLYLVTNMRRYMHSHTFLNGLRFLLFLIVNFAADLLRSHLLNAGSSYEASRSLLGSSLSIMNLLEINKNLFTTFHRYAAGFLANTPILLLSILSYSLHVGSEDFQRLLSCMLSVSTFLILFGKSVSVQSRVLYVLPFPILSVLGLLNLGIILSRSLKESSAGRTFTSVVVVVCLNQLNYLLRSMATLPSFAG
jgi:hypothetical protein